MLRLSWIAANSACATGVRSIPAGQLLGQVGLWVGLVVVGPVSDFSEELAQGCVPVTLWAVATISGRPDRSAAERLQSAVSIRKTAVARGCFRAQGAPLLLLLSRRLVSQKMRSALANMLIWVLP